MRILPTFGASRVDRHDARPCRSPSARRLALEPLETRTALSIGPAAGLAGIDPDQADVVPALIGRVAAAWAAARTGVASPATVAGLEGIDAGSRGEERITAAAGPIQQSTAADGSIPTDQAGIDGPVPTVSAFVRGAVAAYLQAGESTGNPRPILNLPPIPPRLISLGRFFPSDLDAIHGDHRIHYDNISISVASHSHAIGTEGLASITEELESAVPATQEVGWAGTGWTSYLMAGGRGLARWQGVASQGGAFWGPDSSPEPMSPPAAITAGDIPLDILLGDPGLAAPDAAAGLQRVAELTPVEESALALVATLWSVPTDSLSPPADDGGSLGGRKGSDAPSASPPPWAAFVIGLDDAFGRSRDACAKALRDGERRDHAVPGGAVERWLQWPCSTVLASDLARRSEVSAGDPAIPLGGFASERSVPSGDRERVARPGLGHGERDDAGDWQRPIEAVAPLALAASGSALFAGWLWAGRRLRQGWRLGGTGRRGRGGTDRSAGEGS